MQFLIAGGTLPPQDLEKLAADIEGDSTKPGFKTVRWYASQLKWHNANEEPKVLDFHITRIGQDEFHLILEVEGTFVEVMELESFPFDHQSLQVNLRIACAREGQAPVQFSGFEHAIRSIDRQNFGLQNSWKLEPTLEVRQDSHSSFDERTYPILVFCAHVHRMPG